MYQIILTSLSRQTKALEVLRELLEEEYSSLLARDTKVIASLEFSIQELIRQLAVEKTLIMRTLNGQRVKQFAEGLPDEQNEIILRLYLEIDTGEQTVSRQASRNAQLSLALLDQSAQTLNALKSQITPPSAGVYGRHGALRQERRPQAAIISGRL